jgi:hypothetical protein
MRYGSLKNSKAQIVRFGESVNNPVSFILRVSHREQQSPGSLKTRRTAEQAIGGFLDDFFSAVKIRETKAEQAHA